jgi:TolA-binding protein
MEKKTVWIALGSGLVAGLVAATIVCTACYNMPSQNETMQVFPSRMEIMKHKMHKHHGPRAMMHHKKWGHPFKEPTPEMKERFAKKLGLSDEQKATLEKYRKEDMAKMKPLFDEMDRIKGELDDLRQANRARFESVLTDEQKEILQQMKAKHHKHGVRGKNMLFDEDVRQDDVASEPADAIAEAPFPVSEAPVETPAVEAEPVNEALETVVEEQSAPQEGPATTTAE